MLNNTGRDISYATAGPGGIVYEQFGQIHIYDLAANKEHQQLMADIRMLQEQSQLLQNLLGTLNESIKAVNTRLDEQTGAMRKTAADQKLQMDNLSGDLRVVREKVDDGVPIDATSGPMLGPLEPSTRPDTETVGAEPAPPLRRHALYTSSGRPGIQSIHAASVLPARDHGQSSL